MTKRIFALIFFLPCASSLCQSPNYEQVGLEYFVKEVFPKEYPKGTKVLYSTEISQDRSGGGNAVCFKDYYTQQLSDTDMQMLKQGREQYASQRAGNLVSVKPDNIFVRTENLKQRPTKKRKVLKVSSADTFKLGMFFVELVVYEPHREDHYSIEIDSRTGSVTRWCKNKVVY